MTKRTNRISPLSASTGTSADVSRDPGMLLERMIRMLGYRGRLPQAWLRLIGIVLAVVLALALIAGAIAAARFVMQTIVPTSTLAPTQTSARDSFTLSGGVEQIGSTEWVVEKVPVTVDAQTAIDGIPGIGASAIIQGLIEEDGMLRARTITITQTDAVAPVPTVALPAVVPTEAAPALAPTQSQPTPAPVPSNPAPPIVAGDPFVALRVLIDAGMNDGRIQREGGVSLLEKLNEAQAAAGEGNADKLRDSLRDLEKKTRELVREEKIASSFGQQMFDGIATITNSYNITPKDTHDKKDDDKGKND